MKITQKITKEPRLKSVRPLKIHGHTTIILIDKNGNKERFDDDNMQTAAIESWLDNCGFLNAPNCDQNNLVEQLLGGVMGFDTAMTEDADIIHVPAGCKMTFNGSVGVLNNAAPTEMGSYSADESGWQNDGSYVQTYDFSTSQANGTIACVCLSGKNYAYAGEGNAVSLVRHSTKASIADLGGTVNAYSGIPGYVFNIDLTASTCQSFSIETVEGVTKGWLRTYRLPISKVNLAGTKTVPVLLDEDEVTIDADLQAATLRVQSLEDNLVLWNVNSSHYPASPKWGTNWTQYLWTLEPDGTLTKETLLNTSGVSDLHGIQAAIFDGDYIFFCDAYGYGESFNNDVTVDTTTIYVLDRSDGTITAITNPYGYAGHGGNVNYWWQALATGGWNFLHGSGDGRIVTTGDYPFVADAVLEACYPTNASTASLGNLEPVDGLIRHIGCNLYREQGYIATINNLSSPVTKTPDKAMKVIYRLTFGDSSEAQRTIESDMREAITRVAEERGLSEEYVEAHTTHNDNTYVIDIPANEEEENNEEVENNDESN